MSRFSRRGQVNPPEDLDEGYNSDYYGARGNAANQPNAGYRNDPYRGEDDGNDGWSSANGRRSANGDGWYSSNEDGNESYGSVSGANRGGSRTTEWGSDWDSDWDADREDDIPMRRPVKAPAPEKPAPYNKGTLYYTPETAQDEREEIIDALKDSHAVVVDLGELDISGMTRMLDFIMGAAYVLEASVRKVRGSFILLSPADVEVSDDELDLPEEDEDEDDDTCGEDDVEA